MDRLASTLSDSSHAGFSFGSFRLEPDGTLLRGETAVHLPPKELAALRLLLAHAGRIVSPLQLKQALWGEVHVSADSIPKCLSSLRSRLEPDECIQTVYKRGYRFITAARPLGEASTGPLPRLAIMPFANGQTVPDHLGPAIAEEMMIRLANARYPVAFVLARDSVFTLAQRGQTAQQVGRKLGADLVMTGTLRALPGSYRLRVEMIRVDDGVQIWVEDLLTPQDRIAGIEAELVRLLAVRLSAGGLTIHASAEPFVERRKRPERKEAYDIFLRGHHEWQTLQRHRMQDGLQHLHKATELDSSLIAARIDLVNLCVTQAFYGFMAPVVAADHVRRTAAAIPDLVDRAEGILPALGWVHFHVDHDLAKAIQAFSASSHLTHDAWTTRLRVMFALSRRRYEEGIGLLREALDEDPFSPWLHSRLAWALHLDGQADASLEQCHAIVEQFPNHEGTCLYGAAILAFHGDTALATELARDLAQRSPYFDLATATHAYALACSGQKDEARAIAERLQWLSRERFVISSFMPAVYVALEDEKAALLELRASRDSRCPWFFQMLADPRLKPLHGLPEFEQMCAILPRMEADAERSLGLEL